MGDIFNIEEEKPETKLILLVEDEVDVATKVIKMINSIKDHSGNQKYEGIWAKNGIEALKLVAKNRSFFGFAESKIKCILLDLRMPEMDGLQFIKRFRQIEKRKIFSRLTPVVFLTAYEDDEKWASGIEHMIADYIRKPLSQRKLESTLKSILDDWDGETLAEITRQRGLKKREVYNQKNKKEDNSEPITDKQLNKVKSNHKKLIMLVEDEKDTAIKIIKIIKSIKNKKDRPKYDVVWAQNGKKAFQLLRKNRRFLGFAANKIKCIFLDLRMPEMDGIQFIKKLRKIERSRLFSRFIPTIFLTAYEDESKWTVATYNLVSDYIVKPVSKIKIEDTLSRLFDEWDAETMAELLKAKEEMKDRFYPLKEIIDEKIDKVKRNPK